MRENWVSLPYWDMEWISTTMLPQNSALDVKKYAFIIVYSKVKIALKIMPQIRQHCQPGVCWLHFFSIKNWPGVPPLGMYHPPGLTQFSSTSLPSFSGGGTDFLQVFLSVDYPLRLYLPPGLTEFPSPSLPASSEFDTAVPWRDIGPGRGSTSIGCYGNGGVGWGWTLETILTELSYIMA